MEGLENDGDEFMSNYNYRLSIGSDPSFASPGWDNPLFLMGEIGNFEASSSSLGCHGEFEFSSCYPVQNVSDLSNVEVMTKLVPWFESGRFSEMADSFGVTEFSQIANGVARKRASDSSFGPYEKAEDELGKSASGECSNAMKEQDKKKSRIENNINPCSTTPSETVKEKSWSEEAPKDQHYIHVRARKGQATNSHSLAERVRREKISERMRLLQELVPGCNKITGKALMLDEIINYVQSLQRQVEFLSMKLATVNPEMNIDIQRILSKNILHSQGSGGSILGFGRDSISSPSFPYRMFQFPGPMQSISSSSLHFSPLHQTVQDNELQSLLQKGYGNASSAIDSNLLHEHLVNLTASDL